MSSAAIVTIRPYQTDDFAAVCAIHDAARLDELAGSVDPRAFRAMNEVAREEKFFDSQTLVACDKNRVVGFVSFLNSYITWLYVDPNHYRRGIGKQLLAEAMKHCGPGCWTNSIAGNKAAIALYLQAGFELVKTMDSDAEGYPCQCVRLALSTSRMRNPNVTRQS